MRRSTLLLAPAALLLLLAGSTLPWTDDGPPYTPDEALRTFELADGFRIEPFAAEPLVQDPVAMEVDEYGRVYVVEMPGYPFDTGGTGRIKRLYDTDGDGYPDSSTVFTDGLVLPTGLMRWKDGLLVTDAPDVLYLEDTDGDGHADLRRVVLTGFARSNPQHNFNAPRYALDNGIYLANNGTIWWTEAFEEKFGGRGHEVYFPDRPEGPRLGRNAYDRNVRFRPDTYELETLSGASQFGHTFDAWGHHFLVNNSHHGYHEVLAARYLARNPDLPIRRATHDTPDHGSAAEVYPITRDPEHQLLTDRGVFTSAAGLTYYRGGLFPSPYEQVTFVAEPVHNLVHADLVEDDGATFVARRLFEGREFLASTDAWFRPVNFYVGPDGALYVIDYYRQIVEHPEWMSEEAAASGALFNGSDRGRIWRVVPEGGPTPGWVDDLALGSAPAERLVEALAHPNAWWRHTAQRLLVDRQEESLVPLLTRLFQERPSALGRLHALWTLEGLGRLDPALLAEALRDEAPGLRENAVRLAERHLAEAPALAESLLAMTDDPDPKVRLQLLLTLGDLDTEAAHAARQRLLYRNLEDEWMQLAALTAPSGRGADLLETAVIRLTDRETEGRRTFFRRIGTILGAVGTSSDRQAAIRQATGAADPGSAWWQAAVLEGLAEGLRRGSVQAAADEQDRLLRTFFESDGPALRRAVLENLAVLGLPEGTSRRSTLDRAARLAADPPGDPALRADALRLLALAAPDAYADLFRSAVDPAEPADVQRAAVAALGAGEGLEDGRFLLERWERMTPEVRDAAVDALMNSEGRMRLLVEAVRNGTVLPAEIGWHRRVRLMRDTQGTLREEARALLREDPGASEAALGAYRAALDLTGAPNRGRAVFARVCSSCHQAPGAEGSDYGPDLGTVRHWPLQDLLEAILVPDRSIADRYTLWVVSLRSGSSVSGLLAAETPTSLTLRTPDGSEVIIPRTELRSIQAAPISAMPTGLETQISLQEMADLLAFLKNSQPGSTAD